MLIEIPNENSIIKWKYRDIDNWKVAEISDLIQAYEKLQGKREFIGIIIDGPSDEICTYLEDKGKPYYSIQYKENNEEFVGYGTYNLEALSRYLREYFFS